MASDNVSHSSDPSSASLIPADVDHVDLLNATARNLESLALILEAAAVGSSSFAAVCGVLRPVNEHLQQFKNWFNHG